MKNPVNKKLNEFHKLLVEKGVSSVIIDSFNDLRNFIADNLREASDFVATKEVIDEVQKECLVQSTFGELVNPFKPDLMHLQPEQIALSLGREYRFWNQTELTVAEHCVNMANYCQEIFPNKPELAMWSMFHELGEVTMGDTATPIKDIVPGIRKNENILLANYARELGLEEKMPHEVHFLDKRMMITEALMYMPDNKYWLGVAKEMSKDFNVKLTPVQSSYIKENPLSPNEAIELFAKKWIELGLPTTVALELMAEGKIKEAIAGRREKETTLNQLVSKDSMKLTEKELAVLVQEEFVKNINALKVHPPDIN
ncbi:MAG: hypothetical protein A3F91_09405 [Flavobacteria bacterium RIFCSPLOWO2_12_FULL_35_11]|nr:MAG: hypothetical protein A3F91_09405 [Flavobacteria bacterium RIFCSPLOWO2_12_FULL_35_11]